MVNQILVWDIVIQQQALVAHCEVIEAVTAIDIVTSVNREAGLSAFCHRKHLTAAHGDSLDKHSTAARSEGCGESEGLNTIDGACATPPSLIEAVAEVNAPG